MPDYALRRIVWHLDFHHGSRRVLTSSGRDVKPLLLCIIDDHSRLICHLQWYLDETAEEIGRASCRERV